MRKNICHVAFIFLFMSLSTFSQTVINTIKQPSNNQGYVFISPDFSSDKIDTVAGTLLYFTLTAKDNLGNIIQDWNSSGSTITVLLKNSSANTDSSKQSWNSDLNGYSYAMLLITNSSLPQPQKVSDDSWEISPTSFVQGQAQLCLIDTKSERNIYLQIFPQRDSVKQSSAIMNFKPAPIANFLVEITSQTKLADQVYQMRKHEVVVTPRDKYLNYTDDAIKTRFTARFPGEYDNSSIPDPLGGDQNIKGQTPFLFISTTSRKKPNDLLQQVAVFASPNMSIRGKSDDYEILTHEPGPFKLISPKDTIQIETNSKWTLTHTFRWSEPNPTDVYKNIHVSRFNTETISDIIYYTWIVSDPFNYYTLRYPSSQRGILSEITLSDSELVRIIRLISGNPAIKRQELVWRVEATDSVYTKICDQTKGYHFTFQPWFPDAIPPTDIPSFVKLNQNYPNPFGARIGNGTSSTMILFSLDRSSQIILKVYDALGKDLSIIANQFYEAGEHSVTFDAANLPAGNYFYRLFANGKVLTKQMTVVK